MLVVKAVQEQSCTALFFLILFKNEYHESLEMSSVY